MHFSFLSAFSAFILFFCVANERKEKKFHFVIYTRNFPIRELCISNPSRCSAITQATEKERMTKEGGNTSQDLWDFIVP